MPVIHNDDVRITGLVYNVDMLIQQGFTEVADDMVSAMATLNSDGLTGIIALQLSIRFSRSD
jgi:hypothetical protein